MKRKKYMGDFGDVTTIVPSTSTALAPLTDAQNLNTPAASLLSTMNIAEPSDVAMKLADSYAQAGVNKLAMVASAANLPSLTADRIKTILAALGLWQLFAFLKRDPKKTLIWGGLAFVVIANREKIMGLVSGSPSTTNTASTTTPASTIPTTATTISQS